MNVLTLLLANTLFLFLVFIVLLFISLKGPKKSKSRKRVPQDLQKIKDQIVDES